MGQLTLKRVGQITVKYALQERTGLPPTLINSWTGLLVLTTLYRE